MDLTKKSNFRLKLPALFRWLFIIGAVALISLLFPNSAKFKYEFEAGRAWRYEDLVAPFNFGILKPADELAKERAEIAQTVSPVYEIDADISRQQKQLFLNSFDTQLQVAQQNGQFPDVIQRADRYQQYGAAFLDRIFQRGIIRVDPEHADKGDDLVITVLRGNTTQEQTIENVLRSADAITIVGDSLPYSPLTEPDFLLPLLETAIRPNLFYNDTLTQRFRQQALNQIPNTRGLVVKEELIVSEGEIITNDIYQKLLSFQEQYSREVSVRKSRTGVFFGYLLLTSLLILVFVGYLRSFAPLVYSRFNKMIFILLWPVLFAYLVFVVQRAGLSPYLIPFCIVPIVINTFYNERLALFTHIVTILIASFLSDLGYEFTFLQILAGIVVLLSNVDTRDWSKFFNSLLFIFLSYAVGFFGLSLIQEGDPMQTDWSVYTWIGLNVFLTLLSYPLIPLMERLFGFVSPITLTELSDMNRPLLRELSLRAPGTLQHSLQVANLAEAAARRIGADTLLVKVAALYHDIGKTSNPAFFIENQVGRNPHEGISDLESAKIIIGHVTDGVQMAKKGGLPPLLIDFIRTHHGTTRVEYFYRNYLKDHPEEELNEAQFHYPGPRPRSKEESILMMADSIEAACKSLKNATDEELTTLIDKIINGKITNGQLENSQLSFRELEDCREVFKSIMRSIYHVRIEYPEDRKDTHTRPAEG